MFLLRQPDSLPGGGGTEVTGAGGTAVKGARHHDEGATVPSGPSSRSSAPGYRVTLVLLVALIAYGSLYPFTWQFDRPREFVLLGPVGRVDLVENIVLFLPLGCVLGWRGAASKRHFATFAGWFTFCAVFAAVLQWLQIYLPRTPALSDVLFNLVGYVLGWGIGTTGATLLASRVARRAGWTEADHRGTLLVVLWIVAELYPLVPSLDVSTVWHNVKSLWQQELWQPRRLLEHAGMTVIGLEAFGVLWRSIGQRSAQRLLVASAAFLVLCGKFVMVHQQPGMAVVLGIVLGATAWCLVASCADRVRAYSVLAVAATTYLIHALAPYDWQWPPGEMHWIPFRSALETGIVRVGGTLAFESLCFAAIVWSAVRLGASAAVMTALAAGLALAAEAAQLFLPGRTAETTSVVMAGLAGWAVAALRPPRLTRPATGAGASRQTRGVPGREAPQRPMP